MWLDRLAGGQATGSSSSTPQPSSRPYSPLPRRTSSSLSPYVTSQRAGHSPRSSSLSLASNDSSTSLLSSSRKPNGSGLRQASTVYEGPDSIEILERLLRLEDGEDAGTGKHGGVIKEEDFQLDPDFGGLSLKELADSETQDDDELSISSPRTQSAEECLFPNNEVDHAAINNLLDEKQKGKVDDLHRSINACDDVLNSVETYLTSFRNDLAVVSADIESLQTRSTALNRRLDNRKAVEKALGPLVEELSVSPEVISKISEGHIDESWAKMLNEIDRRAAAQEKRPNSRQIKASEDLGPLLDKLTAKVRK